MAKKQSEFKTKSKTKSKLRPSPSAHASEQNVATIKTGNDKNKWIVMENKYKIKKWVKLYGKISKYKTHENGARPFYVVIHNKGIIIFKATDLYAEKKLQKKMFNKEIKFDPWSTCMTISNYTNFFIGKNTKKYTSHSSYGSFTGNSILVETKPLHYIFIGDRIVEFKTIEPVLQYFSPMGNNDVPYPFAITKNYVYLMLDFVYMERENDDSSPYPSFYGYGDEYTSKPKKVSNKVLVNRWM